MPSLADSHKLPCYYELGYFPNLVTYSGGMVYNYDAAGSGCYVKVTQANSSGYIRIRCTVGVPFVLDMTNGVFQHFLLHIYPPNEINSGNSIESGDLMTELNNIKVPIIAVIPMIIYHDTASGNLKRYATFL